MARQTRRSVTGVPAAAAEGAPRRVVMIIYPGVAPLDVAGPLQVFGLCNHLRGRKSYDVITAAPTAEPVTTPIGITFLPTCAMDAVALPIDTLLVSGAGHPDSAVAAPISAWLRTATAQSRRFGSICTGAFALGAAGLIDGRRVTTHWRYADSLARTYPLAKVDADPIFIRDGNLYTSGGIAAGIDLGLALLEEDFGREFALEVSRHLVLFLKRSGGQAQFSTHLKAQFSRIPAIERVQSWCLENLARDLSVGKMAKQAVMSERNFVRIFHQETGQTPAQFVATARLESARRLLEETQGTHRDIAIRCGFGGVAAMRRAFRDRLGVGPTEYREKFSVAEPAAGPAGV